MRDFLLTVWNWISNIFSFLLPIGVFLFFFLQCTEIKELEVKQIQASEQIVETQVDLYNAYVDAENKHNITEVKLAKDISQVKRDNAQNNYNVLKTVYGVDQRSLGRDQGIVDGVNKLVDDVSYALQKPSYTYLKNITVLLVAKATDPNAPDGKKGWLGTGVIIGITDNYTYILTNRHVVAQFGDGQFKYYIRTDDNRIPFEVLKVSKDDAIDLALIRVTGSIPGKTAVIGFGHEPNPQDPVFLVGHNLGRPYLYDEGQVAGYDIDSGDLIVDMPVGPGNSGSGIINKDGGLVGILYAGSIIDQEGLNQMDTGHGLCVDIKHIRLFLAKFLKDQ